ncbi:hypothetical protein PV08_00796 [Exophiala spinifera]|uniref:Major facilitator superfamily (MFS) profile domain-containing protein n=1 Tax=Exophiala spinifera TaxID=91928 RepID=A0A0D1YY59_9EURO|nr:uncharacterized protein PV08_00796 [Exophiala spinifera]KIW20221.1 hypothetical protein PV08_00796 [Exophiala spinifera]
MSEAESTPVERRGLGFHLKHNKRLLLTVLALASPVFTYGYDGIIIGGTLAAPAFVKQFSHGKRLTSTDVSIIVAVPNGGSVIGSLIVAYGGDLLGRRKTLLVGCLINLIGAAMQTASSDLGLLTAGRVFSNAAAYVFLGMTVTFLNEVAPASLRGIIGGLTIFSINVGVVLGSGISLATWDIPNSGAWRLPLGLQLIWPLLIAIFVFFVRESPTSYIIKGDDEQALVSLRKIRKGYSEEELEEEMTSLKLQDSIRQAEKEVGWIELFRGVNLRRTLLSAFMANVTTLSGVIYASNYATIFLRQIGSTNPFVLVLGLGLLAFGGSGAGLALIHLLDRRRLALSVFSAIFVIDLVIGVMGCLDTTATYKIKTIAAFSLMYGFFYAAGFGPLVYTSTAEIPNARLRNKTAAFTFITNVANSTVCLFVFPYITSDPGNLGAKVYLLFAGCMFLVIAITWLFFPEVKGRTPAEVDEMFNMKLPARKFKGTWIGLPLSGSRSFHSLAGSYGRVLMPVLGYTCAVAPKSIHQQLKDERHIEQVEVSKTGD